MPLSIAEAKRKQAIANYLAPVTPEEEAKAKRKQAILEGAPQTFKEQLAEAGQVFIKPFLRGIGFGNLDVAIRYPEGTSISRFLPAPILTPVYGGMINPTVSQPSIGGMIDPTAGLRPPLFMPRKPSPSLTKTPKEPATKTDNLGIGGFPHIRYQEKGKPMLDYSTTSVTTPTPYGIIGYDKDGKPIYHGLPKGSPYRTGEGGILNFIKGSAADIGPARETTVEGRGIAIPPVRSYGDFYSNIGRLKGIAAIPEQQIKKRKMDIEEMGKHEITNISVPNPKSPTGYSYVDKQGNPIAVAPLQKEEMKIGAVKENLLKKMVTGERFTEGEQKAWSALNSEDKIIFGKVIDALNQNMFFAEPDPNIRKKIAEEVINEIKRIYSNTENHAVTAQGEIIKHPMTPQDKAALAAGYTLAEINAYKKSKGLD